MNYSKTLQKHLTDQKSYVSNKKVLSVSQKHYLNLLVYKYGGEGGIRTHGTVAGTLVFKTRALNHSTTSPDGLLSFSRLISIAQGSDSQQ